MSPTYVEGARYVVLDNPKRGDGFEHGIPTAGKTVTLTELPDEDGDVEVESDGIYRFVHVGCLRPALEIGKQYRVISRERGPGMFPSISCQVGDVLTCGRAELDGDGEVRFDAGAGRTFVYLAPTSVSHIEPEPETVEPENTEAPLRQADLSDFQRVVDECVRDLANLYVRPSAPTVNVSNLFSQIPGVQFGTFEQELPPVEELPLAYALDVVAYFSARSAGMATS